MTSQLDKTAEKSLNEKISFNAGPTYISKSTRQAIKDIVDSGFLQTSHRSKEFSEVSRQAIEGMRTQMGIPKDYHIFYQNSSTIAWDTVIQNCVAKSALHFVCGEFSKRFYETSEKLISHPEKYETSSGQAVDWQNAVIKPGTELITITHNETRSGLMWPEMVISKIRKQNPESLLAIDVCSSFGAMSFNWEDADIWLGSVQKGLAMPTGLGYLFVSPRAYEKAIKLNKSIPKWHSFSIMREQMKVYQTYETPNLLEIALLAKLMEDWNIHEIEAETRRKADLIYHANLEWTPHCDDKEWQSITSMQFIVDDAKKWHKKAEGANFALGHCFGDLANSGIRICNFPSHTYQMFQELITALK